MVGQRKSVYKKSIGGYVVIKRTELGDLTIVAIEGEMLGGADAAALSSSLTQVRKAKRGVIIDLTKCTGLDSPVLSNLIRVYQSFTQAELFICLVAAGEKNVLQRTTVIAQLSNCWLIFDSIEQAEVAYSKSPEKQRADAHFLREIEQHAIEAELRRE